MSQGVGGWCIYICSTDVMLDNVRCFLCPLKIMCILLWQISSFSSLIIPLNSQREVSFSEMFLLCFRNTLRDGSWKMSHCDSVFNLIYHVFQFIN